MKCNIAVSNTEESRQGSVEGVTGSSRRHQRRGRLRNVESAPVRVDKRKGSVESEVVEEGHGMLVEKRSSKY